MSTTTESLRQDIRLAIRALVKDRSFTFAAVVVLALGIASTGTVFTLVNGALLRDMPFADPDRIVDMGGVSYVLQRGESDEDLGVDDRMMKSDPACAACHSMADDQSNQSSSSVMTSSRTLESTGVQATVSAASAA